MGMLVSKVFDPERADFDIKKVDEDNLYFKKAMKVREEMTEWERVNSVFTRDEFGDLTPEMHRIKDATLIGLFVGAAIGGIGRSRIAYMDFFRQNVDKVFETPMQAKRALQDRVTLGMGSGAFRLGWRIAAFTFMYMTTSTVICAYRGKAGMLDQVGGASVAGFLYKFRDGPKAAVSGTVIGGMLGVVSGSLTVLAIKAFGIDYETANLQYYKLLQQRQEKEHQSTVNIREKTAAAGNLGKFHDQLLAMSSPSSESSDSNSSSSQKSTNASS